MQLPRDVQPLLVGAASRGLLPGALGFVRPPLGLPQRLPRGAGGDQPRQLERAPGPAERLTHRQVLWRGEGRERQGDKHQHGRDDRD